MAGLWPLQGCLATVIEPWRPQSRARRLFPIALPEQGALMAAVWLGLACGRAPQGLLAADVCSWHLGYLQHHPSLDQPSPPHSPKLLLLKHTIHTCYKIGGPVKSLPASRPHSSSSRSATSVETIESPFLFLLRFHTVKKSPRLGGS